MKTLIFEQKSDETAEQFQDRINTTIDAIELKDNAFIKESQNYLNSDERLIMIYLVITPAKIISNLLASPELPGIVTKLFSFLGLKEDFFNPKPQPEMKPLTKEDILVELLRIKEYCDKKIGVPILLSNYIIFTLAEQDTLVTATKETGIYKWQLPSDKTIEEFVDRYFDLLTNSDI